MCKIKILTDLIKLLFEHSFMNFVLFFQSCQLFMSVAIENAGIDYHVVLAQNALQLCLDNWELQAELLCALVKQTSRHASHKHGVQVFSKLRHRVSSPTHCFFGIKKKQSCHYCN